MPGALFRWRQELVRDATCMYIPGLGAHHSGQDALRKGRTHRGWSPLAAACTQAPSPSPAWEPVSLCPRRSLRSPQDPCSASPFSAQLRRPHGSHLPSQYPRSGHERLAIGCPVLPGSRSPRKPGQRPSSRHPSRTLRGPAPPCAAPEKGTPGLVWSGSVSGRSDNRLRAAEGPGTPAGAPGSGAQ